MHSAQDIIEWPQLDHDQISYLTYRTAKLLFQGRRWSLFIRFDTVVSDIYRQPHPSLGEVWRGLEILPQWVGLQGFHVSPCTHI